VNDGGGVGWTFLVARGRHQGFRPVLAPDFLVRADRQHLLSERVGADGTGSGEASLTRIDDEQDPLTVSFRVEPATADMVDGAEAGRDGVLTDRHGRPLELLYGVVTRGRTAVVGEADLDAAREEALASYRRFRSDEKGFAVQASLGRVLQEAPTVLLSGAGTRWAPQAEPEPGAHVVGAVEATPSGRPVPPRSPAPPRPRTGAVPRPLLAAVPRPGAIGALVGLGILLLAMMLLLDDDVHVTMAVEPDGGRVSCDEGRMLIADIEVDGPMAITYRWGMRNDDGEVVLLPDADEPDRDDETWSGENADEPERNDADLGRQHSADADLRRGPPTDSKTGSENEPTSDRHRDSRWPGLADNPSHNAGDHDFDSPGKTQVTYPVRFPVPDATYVLEVTNMADAERTTSELQLDCRRN
jgi:hypothetical protein